MEIRTTINDEAKAALFAMFGEPPEDPENAITDQEWAAGIINHLLERYTERGQKRQDVEVTRQFGDGHTELTKRAHAAVARKVAKEEAAKLRKAADEAEARANG